MKEHPKTKGFLQGLYGQILKVEALRRSKGKKALKAETIKSLVYDFTMNLIAQINAEADKRIQSDIVRLQKEREAQRKQDLELASKGKFVGEFEELKDIITTDERSV
jgi:phosphoglycolate phosphatase-like HAD superfamily hydrolase